jgi:hypothetical protein
MRSRLLFAALLLSAALPLSLPALCRADGKDDVPKETDEVRLKKLLTERRDALRTLIDADKKLVAAGQASAESMVEDAKKLLRVELELAEKPADRVTLREEFLKLAQAAENTAETRFKAGMITLTDYGKVKDERLEAEIDLLREKMKAKPAAPK